jgi:hypothetical protein
VTRASTRRLLPAELKDGRYVRPCGDLEVEQLWCGRREVWTVSHGLATRYHVMVDGGMAACRSKQAHRWQPFSLIVLGALIPIAEVLTNLCCQRNGCRQLYEAFLA